MLRNRGLVPNALLLLSFLIVTGPALTSALEVPRPVSPGRLGGPASSASACPVFSFTGVDGARSYELAVLELPEGATRAAVERSTVALHVELPGGSTAWSPPLDDCLEPRSEYLWSIRATTADGVGEWSKPARFRVPSAPTAEELDWALGILERHRQATSSDLAAPDSAPADTTPADAEAPLPSPSTSHTPARVSSRLAASPDAVGLSANLDASSGINFAVRGESASDTAGAAGVVGIASGTAGDNAGVLGQSDSAAGAAGHFDNTAGGDILRGLVNGVERFSVDGAGNVAATSFAGDGSLLTDVESLAAGTVSGGPGGVVLDSSITSQDIDSSQVQERITGICGSNDAIRAVGSNGAVTCTSIPQGDVTSVVAGTGIDVTGSSGPNPTVSIETDGVEPRHMDPVTDSSFLTLSTGQVTGSNYVVSPTPEFTIPLGEVWQCVVSVNASFRQDSTDSGYYSVTPFAQIGTTGTRYFAGSTSNTYTRRDLITAGGNPGAVSLSATGTVTLTTPTAYHLGCRVYQSSSTTTDDNIYCEVSSICF